MTHDEKMTDEAIEIKPLGTRLGHQRTFIRGNCSGKRFNL